MAWIILDGLDRCGKTTLAKLYEKQGYKLIHLSAPDKKYFVAGYTGPSYLDEMLDLYMRFNAVDTVFDRSVYGETVWPLVYNRKTQLDEEAFEILKEIEDNNQTKYYLLYDTDVAAHWKRCVENKEPLNRNQFNQANLFFDRMAAKHGFTKIQLQEALSASTDYIAPVMTDAEKKKLEADMKKSVTVSNGANSTSTITMSEPYTYVGTPSPLKATQSPEQMKLEKANAINDVLSKRILKQKGTLYDAIENDIREHLNNKLGTIMGSVNEFNSLSKEDIEILKVYCQQIKKNLKKMENR